MKSSAKKIKNKKYSNMSSKEKSEVKLGLFIMAVFVLFVIFWVASNFLFALGFSLFIGSFYLIFKAVKKKTNRAKYIVSASIIIFVSFIFLGSGSTGSPSTDNTQQESSVAQTNTEDQQRDAELKEKQAQAAEQKRLEEIEKKRALAQQDTQTGDLYRVTSITDGDTIKVNINGVTETVRFIGMDTPETKDPTKPVQCYGKEASSKMQHYAQSKKVRLEADTSQGDKDKYGRLLRYVYTEDGLNIAYEMIKGGYAHEYTYDKAYKYQNQFKLAEQSAKDAKSGLWATNTCNGVTNQSLPVTPPAAAKSPSTPTTPSAPSAYYKNCTAARAAGVAPVYAGQPGYGTHLDRDGDGIGCEK